MQEKQDMREEQNMQQGQDTRREQGVSKRIDARGKQCPIPLIEAKKALEKMNGGILGISVDNLIAVQNLLKMAGQKKLEAGYEKIDENHYAVRIHGGETGAAGGGHAGGGNGKTDEAHASGETGAAGEEDAGFCAPCSSDARRRGSTVVALTSDRMGAGDDELGKILMKGFIYALTEQETLPETILLYNGGAKLSTGDSDSLADLKLLQSQGVEILTCGTCLNHYGLTEKLAVGTVTNMYVIAEKLTQADKMIRP